MPDCMSLTWAHQSCVTLRKSFSTFSKASMTQRRFLNAGSNDRKRLQEGL